MEIRRALVSVSDKTGVAAFVRKLVAMDWEIVSTGGTAKILREAGIPIIPIEQVTGSPEAFGGRMKTISFQVGSAILYRRDDPNDVREAEELRVVPISMVVCNLYPFGEVIRKPDCTFQDAVENIDIGGPTMIRAGAKNFESVTVVVDPADYDEVISEMKSNNGNTTRETRYSLMIKVFEVMSSYNLDIARYFRQHTRLPE